MSDWGPFSLDGKNAIVTGGALGIGWSVTSRFIEAGANVVIADIQPQAAETKLPSLAHPNRAATVNLDVTSRGAGEEAVQFCVDTFGSVDVLVNNAGIYPHVAMLEMDEESFRRVIEVNLIGLAFVSKAAGKHMVANNNPGVIINMASIDGFHPSRIGLAAYDVSKGGVVMFTRYLALELAPHGIRVNAIAPGGISTEGTRNYSIFPADMTSDDIETMLAEFVEVKVPLKRLGDPDDVATAAVFLASSASSYITGEVLVVDGGTLLT